MTFSIHNSNDEGHKSHQKTRVDYIPLSTHTRTPVGTLGMHNTPQDRHHTALLGYQNHQQDMPTLINRMFPLNNQ